MSMTTIYYFTGTGNSLAVAKGIAEQLGETDLIAIPSLMQIDGEIVAPSGKVGIICPVYDSGIPVMVRDFLHRLKIPDSGYTFAVITMGGTGAAALKLIDRALQANNNSLDAGFIVKMPGNFPPVSKIPSEEKVAATLRKAEPEIKRIAACVKNGERRRVGLYPVSSLIQAAIYGGFASGVHGMDERFSVSDACTSCGTCVSVCPAGNISIADNKPEFLHRCELCCACLNFCPAQAIDLAFLMGTKGRGRYHHPGVRVADMKEQKIGR